MQSIILAAGYGERFRSCGYTTIKPLLPMSDKRPVLQWVCAMLPEQNQMIVARDVDRNAFASHTGDLKIVWIDDPPIGPLACLAQVPINSDEELLISHCDSLLYEHANKFIASARASGCAMAIVLFASDDPRYGYWNGSHIIEKQVISPFAVAGLYYFRHGSIAIERMRAADPAAGVWSLMHGDVHTYTVDRVIDIGTPDDYEAFLAEACITP